jgi:hypothetical protein
MNIAEKEFISFVDAKCKFGEDGQHWRYGALDAYVYKIKSGGYYVAVSDNEIEITLASSRKDVRRFASIDSAGKFLRSAGFRSFAVNLI